MHVFEIGRCITGAIAAAEHGERRTACFEPAFARPVNVLFALLVHAHVGLHRGGASTAAS
jgi:hypothetical protein